MAICSCGREMVKLGHYAVLSKIHAQCPLAHCTGLCWVCMPLKLRLSGEGQSTRGVCLEFGQKGALAVMS